MNARYATLLLSSVDACVLWFARPHPLDLVGRLGAPRAWLARSPDAALAQVSATALWLIAAWLGAGIAATLLARLPGALGRLCSAASRRLLPAALRRMVAGSVGLSVLLAPVPVALGSMSATAAAAHVLPAPVWPGVDAAGRHSAPQRTTPVPPVPPVPPLRAGRPVVVRPGDSLWLIAARRLGSAATDADVAAAWPRWYAANRDRIGEDPGLIQPGQRLIPPSGGARS